MGRVRVRFTIKGTGFSLPHRRGCSKQGPWRAHEGMAKSHFASSFGLVNVQGEGRGIPSRFDVNGGRTPPDRPAQHSSEDQSARRSECSVSAQSKTGHRLLIDLDELIWGLGLVCTRPLSRRRGGVPLRCLLQLSIVHTHPVRVLTRPGSSTRGPGPRNPLGRHRRISERW
jgi:hypothetical protein